MKLGITKFIMTAAIAALVVVAGSPAARAQSCPTSPYYSPDFTSNQGCLKLNGNASFPVPTASAATITSWSGASGVVTFQGSNSFAAGQPIILSGFTSKYFNGLTFAVLSAGLTTSEFSVAYSGFSGSGMMEAGNATPLNVLQLTPNSTGQAGSAWYTTQQPVASAFSTTFTFQLSGSSTGIPADGIAFVIQNSPVSPTPTTPPGGGTSALGPDGCGVGFGDDLTQTNPCTSSSGGIPNSLAVEFKTYDDGYPTYPNTSNSVSILSNGTSANCISESCAIAVNNSLPAGITLSDGNIHTVTISYTLQPSASSIPNCISSEPCLDVILDGNDLFSGGVPVNLGTLLSLNDNDAWVGFTGATGGDDDNQDILSWTFTPQEQSQSGTVTTGVETVFSFNGGFSPTTPTGYDYNGEQVNTDAPVAAVVTAIPQASQSACNLIVQANSQFKTAQCIVYENGGGPEVDLPVFFELTCPPGEACGSTGNPFNAILGSDFWFTYSDNSGLPMPMAPPLPYQPSFGVLKGAGPDPAHPCTPYPENSPPLFSSNQISSFALAPGEPPANAKAGSGGTGSCWALTYLTPNEAPSVNIVAPVNGGTYQQNQQNASTLANYMCTAVNEGGTSPSGPYLTTASCSATDTPGGSVAPGAQFDTTTLGPHTFTATVVDSALNSVSQTVIYNVVGATDVAILNVAAPTATTGSRLTYVIGVGDPGPFNAVNVIVTDTLAAGTSFLSASGSNVAYPCTTVKGKTTCSKTSTPVSCTSSGGSVSCNVGTIMPLSLSDLNGAVIEITVQVNATGTKKNPTTLVNTAKVSYSNADTNPSNGSSTAKTTVN